MRAALLAIVSCAVIVMVSACSRAPATPVTGSGTRVVVLSPALAVTLTDLGLADRIVGRHAYDLVLEPSVPVCGDQAGIDYESLLRVRPTHILTEWGARPLPARLEQLAKENNWTVRNYTLLSLDQVRSATQEIADEFANGNRAGGAASVIALMDLAWSKRGQGFGAAGRVLLLHSTSPPSVLGPGSFHHQIIERIGGTPAITDGSPFIELDAEDVLKLAPDAIVLVSPRPAEHAARAAPPTAEELRTLLGPLAGLDIPAVKNGRVALIDDPLCALPSTAMISFADELARTLAGWARPPLP